MKIHDADIRPKVKYPRRWEDVDAGSHQYTTDSTERLKVHGGWLIRLQHRSSKTQDVIFLSDPNHEWELEEEAK